MKQNKTRTVSSREVPVPITKDMQYLSGIFFCPIRLCLIILHKYIKVPAPSSSSSAIPIAQVSVVTNRICLLIVKKILSEISPI